MAPSTSSDKPSDGPTDAGKRRNLQTLGIGMKIAETYVAGLVDTP